MRKIFALLALFMTLAAPHPARAIVSLNTLGERPFLRTCTITSAAAATVVHCLKATDFSSLYYAHVTGFIANVVGSTAWGTTANCFLKDTAASPATLATMAVSALTGNSVVGPFTSGVTLGAPILSGTTSQSTGIDLVCNANGTGSNLVVTVYGLIKKI